MPIKFPWNKEKSEDPQPLEDEESQPAKAEELPESEPEEQAPAEEEEDSTPSPLPQAPAATAPKALVEGAFLNGEWEIRRQTRRGELSAYVATDSDFDSHREVQILQQIASAQCYQQTLESGLWQPLDVFSADDCDYAVFEGAEFLPLEDARRQANDDDYLQMLLHLTEGLREWQQHRLSCANEDLWGIDQDGNLRYFGFLHEQEEGVEADYPSLLRSVNERLLNRLFAPAATRRLEDPWSALPFCVETCALVSAIQEQHIDLEQCYERLQEMAPQKVLLAMAALQTDVGQERELNEDSGAVLHMQRKGQLHDYEADLWIVADGMGGHESGEVASAMTISDMHMEVLKNLPQIDAGDNAAVRNMLFQCVQKVNRKVHELDTKHSQPGSTLVAGLRLGRRLFVCNVGDSRGYLWSPKRGLEAVTRDHSYVQDLIDHGELAPEEAFGHPQSNIITSHIGMAKLEQCDVFMRYLLPEDRLLLVCDGVVDMIREEEITALMDSAGSAELCEAIVNASNAAGGADNITALAVDFAEV